MGASRVDLLREPDRLALVLDRLAVLEREDQERLLDRGELREVVRLERLGEGAARVAIERERAHRSAEHVARELVEQDHACERVSWVLRPTIELSARRGVDCRREALPNQRVDPLAAREPEVLARLRSGRVRRGVGEPELEDGFGVHGSAPIKCR